MAVIIHSELDGDKDKLNDDNHKNETILSARSTVSSIYVTTPSSTVAFRGPFGDGFKGPSELLMLLRRVIIINRLTLHKEKLICYQIGHPVRL